MESSESKAKKATSKRALSPTNQSLKALDFHRPWPDKGSRSRTQGANRIGNCDQQEESEEFTMADKTPVRNDKLLGERDTPPWGSLEWEPQKQVYGTYYPEYSESESYNARRLNVTIRSLRADERPREKLADKGPEALSDVELLALILSTGTKAHSALELSRHLLNHFGGFAGLGSVNVQELMTIPGVGIAKASIIAAAFDLGRRRALEERRMETYSKPRDIAAYLRPQLAGLEREVFHVLYLNHANRLITERRAFTGGLTSMMVDPILVFRTAIQVCATRIVIAHNHPSGSVIPSKYDDCITESMIDIGETLGIRVVDHLIITHQGYYSFADEGRLEKLSAKVDSSGKKTK